jgi:transcriptional regulator with XRE-family HTH domain
MHAVADTADSAPVGNEERAQRIQSRLDALGISDREFAERTGIDRKALRRAASGEAVRPSTYTAIETWLGRLEREVGAPELPEGFEYVGDPAESFIAFEVGEGRAKIVVKGPIRDADLLREQAERLVERAEREARERDQP